VKTPPRVELAHIPTPLLPCPRLSARLGVELLVKRDDLTGAELSGNKVRKLEYLLADAQAQGADTVITCGGAQSNHCRATALAAARLGLRSRLLLRIADPAQPPPLEGNILLDRLVGAELVWITPEEYRRRAEISERERAALRAEGRSGYVIPEGGSNALGSWGYIRAIEEMAPSLDGATVVYAAGSGGTGAGLILGVKLAGVNARVVGFNVCDDRAYFVNAIGSICEEAIAAYDLPVRFSRDEIEIVDGYVGRGYAQSRPEELSLLRDVARAEGLVLDPVYTGKAFFGLTSELQGSPGAFGKRIVFVHTGGIFGLFPKAEELAPLL
jgi:D-cysteine desulfhydrase